MKHWRFSLLIFELALFAVILILPQVDLPDFTFRAGSAPVRHMHECAALARLCDDGPSEDPAVASLRAQVHSEMLEVALPRPCIPVFRGFAF